MAATATDANMAVAAANGKWDEVTTLIEAGEDVDAKTPFISFKRNWTEDRTALHFAALEGKMDFVQALLSKECDVNPSDRKGDTPITLAACNERWEVCLYLSGNGATFSGVASRKAEAAFLTALKADRLDVTRAFLKCDPDLRSLSTLLTRTIGKQQWALAETLLDAGVQCPKRNRRSIRAPRPIRSLTAAAAIENQWQIVSKLAPAGDDVNYIGGLDERHPMALAGMAEEYEVIETLKNVGGDVNFSHEYSGLTALCKAIWEGDWEYAIGLIRAGSTQLIEENNLQHPLALAAWEGKPQIPEEYLSRCPPEERELCELFLQIAEEVEANGILGAIKQRIEKGDAIATFGPAPLSVAAKKGDWNTVIALTILGADPNRPNPDQHVPAIMAAEAHEWEIALSLIALGADPNAPAEYGLSLLMRATHAEEWNVILGLIAAGANPEGTHVLENAARAGKIHLLQVTLARGTTDVDKNNALREAAWVGECEAIRILVENGADPSSIDTGNELHTRGWTPLLNAAFGRHWDAVKLLVEFEADVDAALPRPYEDEEFDWTGWRTALHLAAGNGELPIVKLLVERGANCDLKDQLEKQPIDLARKNGHTEVVAYFESIQESANC